MFKILKYQIYHAQNRYLYCQCNFYWSQTRDNNSIDYRENINLMCVHLWATTEHESRIQIQNGSKQ